MPTLNASVGSRRPLDCYHDRTTSARGSHRQRQNTGRGKDDSVRTGLGLFFAAAITMMGCASGRDPGTGVRPSVTAEVTVPAEVTPVAEVTVIADPANQAVAADIASLMQQLIVDLNERKYDAALALYSKCAQEKLTVDQLKFGRNSTGQMTLKKVSLMSATESSATAGIETGTEYYIGSANSFKSATRFVLEDGHWRIVGSGSSDCAQ
jgi:hypothetical protein